MQITKLTVSSHFGQNKAPGSGYVTFSDGKDYMFCWDHFGRAYSLSGFTSMVGQPVRRTIRAPKRLELLKARLNA